MSEAIHIVAMAARTPVGLRAETSAAAVRAGISRVREHPFMVDAAGDPLLCGWDATLAPGVLGIERLHLLVEPVVDELVEKLSDVLPLEAGNSQVPCFLGLPLPRPGFDARDLDGVAKTLADRPVPGLGPTGKLVWHPIAQGHASAVLGLQRALVTLREGKAELCVVAGVDSYFDADTLDWLDDDKRLMREGIRGAFPPGEAAAAVALMTDRTRRSLRLPSLAVIADAADGHDPADESSDEGLLGVGLTDVYRRLGQSLPQGARFDDVFIDINDERARTTDYAFATLRCTALFRDASQYATSVTTTGELGAASAPVHWILAAWSHQRCYAPGGNTLISSASWHGLRGAVLIQTGKG